MLDEILEQHNPCKFTDLVNQLPEDLASLIKTSQNGLAKALGLCPVDVSKLDKKFERINSLYNATECTLEGKPCSMSEFIELTWGTEALSVLDKIFGLGEQQ